MTTEAPTLLLLHGLGATSGVWADVVDRLDWQGRVLTPDLPGHGLAPAQDDYTVEALAAAVAQVCDDDEEVVAVGHSLGGCVALCLASGAFRPVVTGVIGLGIKAVWSDDDVTGMAKIAAKGVRWFDSRDEAVARFLLQAGLNGILDANHPAIDDSIAEVDGRWRVSQDPNTFAQQAVDLVGLVGAATCPVILGAGENDAMVSRADLATHVADPRMATGRGHNAQVEDPDWVVDLITEIVERR